MTSEGTFLIPTLNQRQFIGGFRFSRQFGARPWIWVWRGLGSQCAASSINRSAREIGRGHPRRHLGSDAQPGTPEVLLVTAGSPHDGNESAVPTGIRPARRWSSHSRHS